MKAVSSIFGLLLSISIGWAHVGSPNVFFEGKAGPYPIRVVVRPPEAVPGSVQVDIRFQNGGITNVEVQAVLFDAGPQASPAPVRAIGVPPDTNLFNASLWLFQSGSYSLRVVAESITGKGVATIPVTVASLRLPRMPLWFAAMLLLSIGLLVAGATWIAGAASLEYRARSLEDLPNKNSEGRWLKPSAWMFILLIAGICICAFRWKKMDRDFRTRELYQPVPIAAGCLTNGNLRLLQIASAAGNAAHPLAIDSAGQSAKFNGPDDGRVAGWDRLVPDHGKLMHLFLVRLPEFDAFAHVHPVRRNSRTFQNILPPLPGGRYEVYGEVTRENGVGETLVGNILLPDFPGSFSQFRLATNLSNEVFCQSVRSQAGSGPDGLRPGSEAAQPVALDQDDSWHVAPKSAPLSRSNVSLVMGGWTMTFPRSGELFANTDASLRFALFTPDGRPASLQHYMGMPGHAIVRRNDGAVFTHLHPAGTISMAAQELFAQVERERGGGDSNPSDRPMERPASNEVAFPYAFPRAGEYRLWVQMKSDGRVFTGVFDLEVKPAP